MLALAAAFAAGGALGWFAIDVVRSTNRAAIRLVALAAAVAALVDSAAPTGGPAVDAIARVVVAAAAVLIGARSKPWGVAVGAALALAAGGPVAAVAAAAVIGWSTALALISRQPRLANAVGVGALAVVVFRLDRPIDARLSTALGAVALAAPVIWGTARMRGRDRRRIMLGGAVFAGSLALCALAAAATAAWVRGPLTSATASAKAGFDLARAGEIDRARARLARAETDFSLSRDRLEAPWALPGRIVPVVSQHLRAAHAASRAGQRLSAVCVESAASVDLDTVRVTNGRLDLAAVTQLREPLAHVDLALRSARDELTSVRSPWLLNPVDDRLGMEVARLTELSRDADLAKKVVGVLPGLFGADGRRAYFIAMQNPVELRGSGGIVGNYGLLVADEGRVQLAQVGRSKDLNTGGDPSGRVLEGPDDFVSRYGRFQPERIWQNVTMSPDFSTVADVIERLYPASGGQPLDGVLSVDPTALAALLELTGPVAVEAWPEPLTSDNVERILYVDQYARFDNPDRIDFLAEAAEAVMTQLTTTQLPGPRKIVHVLAPAVSGHHLMLTSTKQAEQALFASVGATGALGRLRGDFLAVVNQNASGNKLDAYLERSTEYKATLDAATGAVRATVTVMLTNRAPATGLPKIVGQSLATPPDSFATNRTYLSIYTPWALQGARLNELPVSTESELESDRHVYSLFLAIRPGETKTVTFELAGADLFDGRYRLDLHRQPLVRPERLRVDVRVDGSEVVAVDIPALTEDLTAVASLKK